MLVCFCVHGLVLVCSSVSSEDFDDDSCERVNVKIGRASCRERV